MSPDPQASQAEPAEQIGAGAARADAVVVRRPVATDVRRLAAINVAAWQSAYAGIVPADYLATLDLDAYADRWESRLADFGDADVWVAEVGGQLAAYAITGPYRVQQDAMPEDSSSFGELRAIYADPALQGRGAGTAVHDAALSTLAAAGWTCAMLWVLRDNVTTRRWYAARGWAPDGATSRWHGSGTPLPEVRLRHALPARSGLAGH